MATVVQFTNNTPKQAEPIASPASVQVDFRVLGILPDIVQVYVSGVSGDLGPLKDTVEMNDNVREYSSPLTLAGGTAYFIYLCPRTVTNGVPDNEFDGQYWNNSCVSTSFTTKAPPVPPPPKPGAPNITSIEPHQPTLYNKGNIVVGWAPKFDKYHFMWTGDDPPPTTERGWAEVELNARTFTIQPTIRARTYTFQVQGCNEYIDGDRCSAFTRSAIVMPRNTHSLRRFLELSNVPLDAGIRSLGAPAYSAGIRAMMQLDP